MPTQIVITLHRMLKYYEITAWLFVLHIHCYFSINCIPHSYQNFSVTDTWLLIKKKIDAVSAGVRIKLEILIKKTQIFPVLPYIKVFLTVENITEGKLKQDIFRKFDEVYK